MDRNRAPGRRGRLRLEPSEPGAAAASGARCDLLRARVVGARGRAGRRGRLRVAASRLSGGHGMGPPARHWTRGAECRRWAHPVEIRPRSGRRHGPGVLWSATAGGGEPVEHGRRGLEEGRRAAAARSDGCAPREPRHRRCARLELGVGGALHGTAALHAHRPHQPCLHHHAVAAALLPQPVAGPHEKDAGAMDGAAGAFTRPGPALRSADRNHVTPGRERVSRAPVHRTDAAADRFAGRSRPRDPQVARRAGSRPSYSARSATVGATRDARRAGIHAARRLTSPSAPAASASEVGSHGSRP